MYERVFLIPKKPCLDDLIKTSLFFSGWFKSPYTSLQGMFCNFVKKILKAFGFWKFSTFWGLSVPVRFWRFSRGLVVVVLWKRIFKSLKAFFIGFQIFLYIDEWILCMNSLYINCECRPQLCSVFFPWNKYTHVGNRSSEILTG